MNQTVTLPLFRGQAQSPVYWTDAAIQAGQRVRLTSHKDVERAFNAGLVLNFAGSGPENQDPEIRGLRALGVVVNCPPMFVAR